MARDSHRRERAIASTPQQRADEHERHENVRLRKENTELRADKQRLIEELITMERERDRSPAPPAVVDAVPALELAPNGIDEAVTALRQSQARHHDYQRAVRDGDVVAAIDALTEADRLRHRADELDAHRTAQTWAAEADRWPHEALLQFYHDEIEKMVKALEATQQAVRSVTRHGPTTH